MNHLKHLGESELILSCGKVSESVKAQIQERSCVQRERNIQPLDSMRELLGQEHLGIC
jgi:hypothetical protein